MPQSPAARERIEAKVDSVLRMMTLDEKAGQLNQLAWRRSSGANLAAGAEETVQLVREGKVGSFLNVVDPENARELQRVAVEESRLRIPLLFGLDVIHGFRTIFPIPLAEAASWDPAAAESSARIAATEASVSGINWTFAPMVDIARDPRWGRIAEGSGEDPYLGSVMAAARVRGFQGAGFQDSSTILACPKHFAGYGAAEGGRDYNTSEISERTLREIYLPPFKAAVDAGAQTIMSSFNEIAGIPSSANRKLLTDILRGEWGFTGFVVSDWGAISELRAHGVAETARQAAFEAITAGVDMDMEGRMFVTELPGLVKSGSLPASVLDEAVRRVLRVKIRLGLFDHPYRNCHPGLQRAVILSASHLEAAKKMAEESIVLLKNEHQLLPLRKAASSIAVIGPLARSRRDPLGPWHAEGSSEDVVSVLDAIKSEVSDRATVVFAEGCDSTFSDTSKFGAAVRAAAGSDVVVLVAGETREMSGEAASRSSLGLPGVQEALVRRICSTGEPVVLVLMNGRPLCLPWEAEHVRAIVETWFLGVQSGRAIAEVLFGDTNPSGKLPVSFPRSVGQIPVYYNHKNTGRPFDEQDKYTSKYLDDPITPLFAFGEGLSYTSFGYSNLSIAAPKIHLGDAAKISVEVTNSGRRDGQEIVQLYIHDEVASITRPVMELKGFRRISLKAGETRTVEFDLDTRDLGFYDNAMKYVVEPGPFKVYVGGSSIRTLQGTFEILPPR